MSGLARGASTCLQQHIGSQSLLGRAYVDSVLGIALPSCTNVSLGRDGLEGVYAHHVAP
jgi:hypothetical protein